MPGLFDPLIVRSIQLPNRIMMSPMVQNSANADGTATDWHVVHYGSRAVGGVGLIMVEATAVESRGRINERDLCLYDERHSRALARVVDFCHSQGARVGIQLAHAGRKAWSGSRGRGPETAVAPSALPFEPDWPVPHALSEAEIGALVRSFARAAGLAGAAGFDVVELHGAHGYLINEFLSPVTNKRGDQYGGDRQDRLRFARQVVDAVREVWGERPLFMRLSATDYVAGGIDLPETVAIARELAAAGVDLIDVSSGGIAPVVPVVWRGYQLPYAETIKREVGVPTAAVGLVTEAETAEEIIRNGRADLVVLGRELLRQPYWPLHAARTLGVEVPWPGQYERARPRR
ncbi:MAG: NADH:flavin oxidoreductase/NADH oxidase [Chloroflexota bacterium]